MTHTNSNKPVSLKVRQFPLKSTLMLAAGVGLSLGIPVYALASSQLISQRPNRVELNLVSFSVTQSAYEKIIPQFVAKWKREKGQDVVVKQSYGASTSQSRAVIGGQAADIVALSLAQDITDIQKAGLIKPGWERELDNRSIITRSVVALQTRPGNPKNIQSWADLAKPGIKVITPDPKTSPKRAVEFSSTMGFSNTSR